jgi:hypothetical protein
MRLRYRLTSAMIIGVLMISGSSLGAQPVVTNTIVPFTMSFTNPCNQDPMALTGTIHLLATTTIDSAGVQSEFHFNELDTRATDLATGAQCIDTGNLNENALNFDFSTDTVTGLPMTFTARFTATDRCGSAGGSLIQILVHTTITPDGIATVSFDNSSNPVVKCVGSGG